MAAFCWMLIKGFYLYLFVVKVYNINDKMKVLHGFSWGNYELKPILSLIIFGKIKHELSRILPSPSSSFDSVVTLNFESKGLPALVVSISLGIAAGTGPRIKSYVRENL